MESSGVESTSFLFSLLLFRSNTKRKTLRAVRKCNELATEGFFSRFPHF